MLLSKTTSPKNLFDYDCVTLYMIKNTVFIPKCNVTIKDITVKSCSDLILSHYRRGKRILKREENKMILLRNYGLRKWIIEELHSVCVLEWYLHWQTSNYMNWLKMTKCVRYFQVYKYTNNSYWSEHNRIVLPR